MLTFTASKASFEEQNYGNKNASLLDRPGTKIDF
jgi:hypothetical protein